MFEPTEIALYEAQRRPDYLEKVILAGNPELFLVILLFQAYVERVDISVVAARVKNKVELARHPVLITLVALLRDKPEEFSPALKHFVLQHRLKRCLAYFPRLAQRTQFAVNVPILSSSQVTMLSNKAFHHLILALCGATEWTSHDVFTRSQLNLTESNCVYALEAYLFHHGMSHNVYNTLANAPIKQMTDLQLNNWVGLLSAAGKMTYVEMQRLFSRRKYNLNNRELQAQCDLLQDECRIANQLVGLNDFNVPMVSLDANPANLSNMEAEISVMFDSIASRVTASSTTECWTKFGLLALVATVSMGFACKITSTIICYYNGINSFYQEFAIILGTVVFGVALLGVLGIIYVETLVPEMPSRFAFTLQKRLSMMNEVESLFDCLTLLSASNLLISTESHYYQHAQRILKLLSAPTLTYLERVELHQRANHLEYYLKNKPLDKAPYPLHTRAAEAECRSQFFSLRQRKDAIMHADRGDVLVKDLEAAVLQP